MMLFLNNFKRNKITIFNNKIMKTLLMLFISFKVALNNFVKDCDDVSEPDVENCKSVSHNKNSGYCCYVKLSDDSEFCQLINYNLYLRIVEFVKNSKEGMINGTEITSFDCKESYLKYWTILILIINLFLY